MKKLLNKKNFLILAIIMALTAGIFILFQRQPQQVSQTVKNQRIYAVADQDHLKAKDYESYQLSLVNYARSDMAANDYTAAATTLNEVIKNVPKDKLNTETYTALVKLTQHNNTLKDHKGYLTILIDKLKQEKRLKEANYYQSKLAELR